MGANSTSLPYWQVNVPPDERAEECPDFLRDIGAKDVKTLSTPDAEYTRLSWPAVRELVASHRLDDFQRVPTELRRYIAYGRKLARDHGSVMNFVLAHRLGWTAPVVPADSRPFACPDDFKILCNDWPYGLDERIVHLVVWTKFELEEEPGARDVKDGTRAVIDAFVDRVFSPHLPKDHYIWFKNWDSLKSVKAIEHFHVMLFDPAPEFVQEITNGDVPLFKRVDR